MSLQTKVFTSTEDIRNDLTVRAEVKGGGWFNFFSFTASASYRSMEHTITNGSSFISQVAASVQSTDINLYPASKDIIGSVAKEMLASIKDDYSVNREPYETFISHFGTHFIQVGRLGGIIRQVQTTSESYIKTHTEKEVEAQASAKFGAWLDVKGGIDKSKTAIDSKYTKQTTDVISFFGGKTNLFLQGKTL